MKPAAPCNQLRGSAPSLKGRLSADRMTWVMADPIPRSGHDSLVIARLCPGNPDLRHARIKSGHDSVNPLSAPLHYVFFGHAVVKLKIVLIGASFFIIRCKVGSVDPYWRQILRTRSPGPSTRSLGETKPEVAAFFAIERGNGCGYTRNGDLCGSLFLDHDPRSRN
jgi:hypothetical protein